jgi:hypothetical protein
LVTVFEPLFVLVYIYPIFCLTTVSSDLFPQMPWVACTSPIKYDFLFRYDDHDINLVEGAFFEHGIIAPCLKCYNFQIEIIGQTQQFTLPHLFLVDSIRSADSMQIPQIPYEFPCSSHEVCWGHYGVHGLVYVLL